MNAEAGELVISNLAAWLYTPGPVYGPRARRSVVEVQVLFSNCSCNR
jgi:hypothetical protein